MSYNYDDQFAYENSIPLDKNHFVKTYFCFYNEYIIKRINYIFTFNSVFEECLGDEVFFHTNPDMVVISENLFRLLYNNDYDNWFMDKISIAFTLNCKLSINNIFGDENCIYDEDAKNFNAIYNIDSFTLKFIKKANLSLSEIILWAQIRWCNNMSINFLNSSAGTELSKKIFRTETQLFKDYIDFLNELPYEAYLKTNHWQRFRKAALKAANYTCINCGKKEAKLNVHHKFYYSKGYETFNDVEVLCEECHHNTHLNN